jgi:hypothetical protein
MTARVVRLFPSSAQEPSNQREFEDWWKRYPRRVAKGHARIAFHRARKKATMAELIGGVERYSATVAATEDRFIAHPATWLNGERWLDEAPRATPAAEHPARLRAFTRLGIWLDSWGMRPDDKP